MSNQNPGFPANNDSLAKVAATMARADAPELFDLATRIFDRSQKNTPYEAYTNELSKLYKNDPFLAHEGSFKTRTESETQVFGNEMAEGTLPTATRYGIGRTITWSYIRLGNSFTMTWQAMQDGKVRNFVEGIKNLSGMLNRRRYLDGIHPFTFAFSSSYVNMDGRVVDLTGFDGLPIVDGAHTLFGSASTADNRITGNPAISQASLILAEKIMREESKDGFGNRIVIRQNAIITSDDPETVKTVRQLLDSNTDTTKDNPNITSMVSAYQHIILPYLDSDANGQLDSTKRQMWLLVSTDALEAYYSEKEPTHMRNSYKEPGNGDMTFYASNAYAQRLIDWRGLVLSKGDTSSW